MEPITLFTCTALLAWLLQIALGGWQVSRFNQSLQALPEKGQICIGRSTGTFRPRVVVAVSVDSNGLITDNFIMQGFSVFVRPQREPLLLGIALSEINPAALFPKNKSIQQALTLAIVNKG